MEKLYQKEYILEEAHTDAFGKATVTALLSFAQDIAGEHAAALSASWEVLQEQNLFWAVSRHSIEIARLPQKGEKITLVTWPMPTTKVAYPRAVEGYDQSGKCIFKQVSLWILMDTEKRTLVLPHKSGVAVDGILRGTELPLPSSLPQTNYSQKLQYQVTQEDLDRNGHVNNTRYMHWFETVLSQNGRENYAIQDCVLCYLTEATEGCQVQLVWEMGGNQTAAIEGISADGRRIFAARAHLQRGVL